MLLNIVGRGPFSNLVCSKVGTSENFRGCPAWKKEQLLVDIRWNGKYAPVREKGELVSIKAHCSVNWTAYNLAKWAASTSNVESIPSDSLTLLVAVPLSDLKPP